MGSWYTLVHIKIVFGFKISRWHYVTPMKLMKEMNFEELGSI